jgi:hypothetical protein
MLNEEEKKEVLNRLKNHPAILESLKDILDITEGVKGIEKADDAEFALIPEVRGLGKKFIEDWAKHQAEEKEIETKKEKVRKHFKKK